MRRLILIDNSDVTTTLNSVKSEFEEGEIEVFSFNPAQAKFETDRRLDISKIMEDLSGNFLQNKIDVIGVDFNLHRTDKTISLKILQQIRNYDKCCYTFLYSGGFGKYLYEVMMNEGDDSGDKLLREALSAGIDRVIHGRTETLKTNILELLRSLTPNAQILEILENLNDTVFSDNASILSNKKAKDIAREIKIQSEEGAEYAKEIIEQSLSIMVKVNI